MGIVEVLNINLGLCWSLGGKPHFFVSLGIAEILGLSELSTYTEVVPLKTFLQHFEKYFYCKYWRSNEVL